MIGSTAAGSESPAVDAELLEMLASLLDRLDIQGWSLSYFVGCVTSAASSIEKGESLIDTGYTVNRRGPMRS